MEKSNYLKDNKELMKEYNYEKNKDVDLNTQKVGSAKKIWWKCKKGHSWDAPINDRARGVGCPICSNHRVLKGYNDLESQYPKIAKEWNSLKNKINSDAITCGSSKKVWWVCPKKHEYEASVYSRTVKNTGCPYCAGIKVLKGYNDLESQYPEIAKEWDSNKNDLNPSEVSCGTNKKVWFICPNGHSYLARISSRTVKNTGCPYCAGIKVLKGYNDLESQYPEIAKEWNFEKNNKLPSQVTGRTNEKYWFVCPNGHHYLTRIVSRTSGHDCPYCSNKKVLKGYNDLATRYPNLLKEWDYEKNKLDPTTVVSGSKKKVWWKCKKGHSWKTEIKDRTGMSSHGCPKCNLEKQVSIPEKIVYFYLNKYLGKCNENYSPQNFNKLNIDIFCPSLLIGVEYDGAYFHKNIQRDLKKDLVAKENGIKLYRIREKGCPLLNSSSICINLNNNSNDELEKAVKQILNDNNIVKMDIDINRDLSHVYDLIEFNEKENSLLKKYPIIAKEWNYEKNANLKPDSISYGSNKKVWWKCKMGHEWIATVNDRTGENGYGCPYCSGKRLLKGFNDFGTRYPEIAKEWDYEKNNNLLPSMVKIGTRKKVWWKCPKGHSYDMEVKSRVGGQKCPICSGRRILKGYNDLKSQFPEVVKEWDYEKNINIDPSNITRFSQKKVWWKCEKGHEWQAAISNRTSNKTGCPYCCKKGNKHGNNN